MELIESQIWTQSINVVLVSFLALSFGDRNLSNDSAKNMNANINKQNKWNNKIIHLSWNRSQLSYRNTEYIETIETAQIENEAFYFEIVLLYVLLEITSCASVNDSFLSLLWFD